MKVLFNASHPANFHLFKNAIKILQDRVHEILLTVVDKDVMRFLLKNDPIAHDINCMIIGKDKKGITKKGLETIRIEYNLLRISREFKPDILVGGCGNLYVAHIGKLIKRPSIIFDTNEQAKIQHILTDPFASVICTPSCYEKDLGEKQVRYEGYHELAYLHPNYFRPNSEVLDELEVDKDDNIIILRLVAWKAIHDIGEKGLSRIIDYIKQLENYGRILITSERKISKELDRYKIKEPHKLHDLLFYSTLYIGEGATTASECAVLGTHAIYINTISLGYLKEQEKKYGLVYNFTNPRTMEIDGLKKALELLENDNLKRIGKKKREKLLEDKIDVTKFMIWFVENYPESFEKIKEHPEIQWGFK